MGHPGTPLIPRECSLCGRRWVSRWYADAAFVRALNARWSQLRRAGFVRRTLAGIGRDARAIETAQVRNLRRWPLLSVTPLNPRAPEAALRSAYRVQVARLQEFLRIRAGWLTANLPRIGRL